MGEDNIKIISEEQKEIVNELVEFILERKEWYFEQRKYYDVDYIWFNSPALLEDFYNYYSKKEKNNDTSKTTKNLAK